MEESPVSERKARCTPRLKLIMIADKEDATGLEAQDANAPLSPFSRASTSPLDFSSWEATSPTPLSARSEPSFEYLRASTGSPMSSLASNLACMPICGSMGSTASASSMETLDYGQMMGITPTSTPPPSREESVSPMERNLPMSASPFFGSGGVRPLVFATSPPPTTHHQQQQQQPPHHHHHLAASGQSPTNGSLGSTTTHPPNSTSSMELCGADGASSSLLASHQSLSSSSPAAAVPHSPPFSLSGLSSPVSTMPALSRISPRHHHHHGSSPRLFHSSPGRTILGMMPNASGEIPTSSGSDFPHPTLSTSFSSIEDFASITDSSDSMPFYLDHRSNTSDDCPPTRQLAHEPEVFSFASKTLPHLPPMSQLAAPSRSNSDCHSGRTRSRTVHLERTPVLGETGFAEICQSPTRSRGGTSALQRTASFLSNPRPTPNRTRRDSIPRPRPKPYRDNSSSPDAILSRATPPTGLPDLIPDLKSIELPPPSPSRPLTKLPSFYTKGNITCNRISSHTLVQLLNGEFSHIIPEFYIIDCRSEAEFLGGHIRGAIHSPDANIAINRFITERLPQLQASPHCSNIALIFHCEFSIRRGPNAITKFREVDRALNSWPSLFYPDVYCLDGGYSNIFANHPDVCDPHGYVEEENRENKPAPMKRSHSVSRTLSCSMGHLTAHSTEEDGRSGEDDENGPFLYMPHSARSESAPSHSPLN